MVTVNKKWLQLMGIVGCAIGFASCGQTQKGEMQTGGYETMVVAKADKVVETNTFVLEIDLSVVNELKTIINYK